MKKKFYILERHNPQFDKPYYCAEGQLTKKDAKIRESTVYGTNHMLPYETEDEYKTALTKFEADGFHVYPF